jgi:hypothetical protein
VRFCQLDRRFNPEACNCFRAQYCCWTPKTQSSSFLEHSDVRTFANQALSARLTAGDQLLQVFCQQPTLRLVTIQGTLTLR